MVFLGMALLSGAAKEEWQAGLWKTLPAARNAAQSAHYFNRAHRLSGAHRVCPGAIRAAYGKIRDQFGLVRAYRVHCNHCGFGETICLAAAVFCNR
jgi:hypothetical protein